LETKGPLASALFGMKFFLRRTIVRTWVSEELSSPLIISHHICPKPRFFMTSRTKGHETESNAFVISNFNRILAFFC
jgi:hypothetical protein